MNRDEAKKKLISYVNTAKDLDLILDNYNVLATDAAIRLNSADIEGRLLVIGSKRRNDIFVQIVKNKLINAGKGHIWELIRVTTEDQLQNTVDEIVKELSGTAVEPTQDISAEELKALPNPSEIDQVEGILEDAKKEASAASENIEQSEELPKSGEEANTSTPKEIVDIHDTSKEVGLCRYGVPILNVRKITPDVFGLKESMFVDLGREELEEFFEWAKGKIIE